MGINGDDAAAGSDPGSSRRYPRRSRHSRRCRRSACCSTTVPAARRPGDPLPGFEQSFSSFPHPGHARLAPGISAPAARSATRTPARAGRDAFTWNPHARPRTDFTGDTGRRLRTACGPRARLPVDPARRRAAPSSYLTSPLSANTTVVGAGAVHALGAGPRRRTSTSRRRSARSGPTARRRSSRTAGCAPTSASSTAARAPCSSRS